MFVRQGGESMYPVQPSGAVAAGPRRDAETGVPGGDGASQVGPRQHADPRPPDEPHRRGASRDPGVDALGGRAGEPRGGGAAGPWGQEPPWPGAPLVPQAAETGQVKVSQAFRSE